MCFMVILGSGYLKMLISEDDEDSRLRHMKAQVLSRKKT